jgi:23S rRNA G2445 N2-methylase RlmL
MYTENDRRLESSTTTATKLEFAQEPLVLGKILFEVSESNELSTLDLADNTLATQIFDQMKADDTLAVDGTEFTSNISRNPTVTQEDVNAFVEILRTQTDTGLDTTLGDILVA